MACDPAADNGGLDPRRHPFRPDLAAGRLRGRVNAARFVDGVAHVVVVGRAGLRTGLPRSAGGLPPLDSEVIFGEEFTVYDWSGDWAWGQCATDGYVGWVPRNALVPVAPAYNHSVTHRLTARHSFLFPAPDIKASPTDMLPMGARLRAVGMQGRFLELASGAGFVFAAHAAPAADDVADDVADAVIDGMTGGWRVADPVTAAENLLGTPYLWGGRTPLGVDCSGLAQLCLARAGVAAPRDSDMQRTELGEVIKDAPRRGDLVFFPGHVAFMLDQTRVIHATAFTLSVCVEPLADVALRADPTRGQGVLAVRRLAAR